LQDHSTYSNQVDPTEDEDDDARGNHDAPEGQAQRFLAGRWLIQVAEHVDAKHDHGHRKRDEAVQRTKQRPVASEV